MLRFVVGVTAALLVGGGGYWGYQTSIAADVGAAAMAKVVCSCVFVDGRTLDACRRDDPPGFESIRRAALRRGSCLADWSRGVQSTAKSLVVRWSRKHLIGPG
jgi:hypothetical protein